MTKARTTVEPQQIQIVLISNVAVTELHAEIREKALATIDNTRVERFEVSTEQRGS